MPWTTVTVDSFIAEGFNAAERAAVLSIAGGVSDGLQEILDAQIAEWREAVLLGGTELDADTTTVPGIVRRHLIAIARWNLLLKFPQLRALQTDPRKEAYEKAQEVLEEVAKGDFPVAPEDEDDVVTGGASGGQTRIAMRTDNQIEYEPE